MQEVYFKGDYIKLGQALKLAGAVANGGESKEVIQNGDVILDGRVETQRGKKLFGGEVFEFNGERFTLVKDGNVH